MGFKVGKSIVIQDVTMLDNLRSGGLKATLTNLKHYEIVESNETYFYIEDDNGDLFMVADYEYKFVELVGTKKQRLTALEKRVDELEIYPQSSDKHIEVLEKEISELKLIVHQLRKPSTEISAASVYLEEIPAYGPSTVEDIIEFEGNQYCKVDREACEGDVVVLKGSAQSQYILNGVPYKTFIGRYDCLAIQANGSDHIKLYSDAFKRTLETVNVYELINHDKSPNQQRAEIIEKSKEFVVNHFDNDKLKNEARFKIDDKLRKVELIFSEKPYMALVNYCEEGKVFNEHIQKAIALGRMIGIDVSEFENAVQPNEVVIGMVVKNNLTANVTEDSTEKSFSLCYAKQTEATILDDTNAEYEVTA